MKVSLRQFGKQTRVGFTLVELLVVIGILAILTTLTVSAFTVNDADRVSNSIGTFKNSLEGARSRAISSGEVRGLRLITDPNDPRIVKSMVYIGSNGFFTQGSARMRWIDTGSYWRLLINSGDWDKLIQNDSFDVDNGHRIELPANSGRWYVIQEDPNITGSSTAFKLAQHYQPSQWNSSIGVNGGWSPQPPRSGVATDSEFMDYRLELAPTLLDGAEPILLDPKTCLDLDGSRVPDSWRVLEDKDQDRAFDSMAGDVDEDGDGLFDYVGGYVTEMDILFAPDGTITGNTRTSGIMSFRFAYLSDVILAQPLREIPQGNTFPNVSTYSQFLMYANPEKIHKALTIFPQTGGVVITEIDPTTSGTNGGFNSNIATQPYSYALLGRESN